MPLILGMAAEDIPADTCCYIGGSSEWLPLITKSTTQCVDKNHGISVEDAHYGGFVHVIRLDNLNSQHNNTKENLVSDKVATGIAYTASGGTILGSALNFNEIMLLGGFLLGLATFLYNIWAKERVIKADKQYKKAMLEELKIRGVLNIGQDSSAVGDE